MSVSPAGTAGPAEAGTLDVGQVQAALAGTVFAGKLHAFGSVGSTNALAVEAAQAGVKSGAWVADEQTAGRGRGGHSWHSAAGDGLYVSVLLRPRLAGADALKLSLAAGVAAVNAIEQATGVRIALRWPNDLMDSMDGSNASAGKKLGGILTETALEGGDGALSFAVIGIGINLNQPAMPPELEAIATSLRCSRLGQDTRREVLLPVLLHELAHEVSLVEREVRGEPMPFGILARFEQASPMVRGLAVRVDEDGGYTGVTDGLDTHGLLCVRGADGLVRTVRHGGVRPLERAEPRTP